MDIEKTGFIRLNPPVKVLLELFSIKDGGRHTPVFPFENFRPDMFFSHSQRQFWGQLTVEEYVQPGDSAIALLHATYPYDLECDFKSGSLIDLVQAVKIGSATIL